MQTKTPTQHQAIAQQSTATHALNIYPFAWPNAPVKMYFSRQPYDISSKLHPRTWPVNIARALPGLKSTHEARIHTSFTAPHQAAIALDLELSAENPDFVKHYYRNAIAQYFKGMDGILTRKGFINETLVYVPQEAASTSQFVAYATFSLVVMIGTFTELPELVVSYKGISYVLRQNLNQVLQKCTRDSLGYIACGNRLIKYKDLYSQQRPEGLEMLPMLTNRLRKDLGLEWPARPKENRYQTYKAQVEKFFHNYLSDQRFRTIVPFTNNEMLTLPQDRVWQLMPKFSEMLFGKDFMGNAHINTHAFAGMRTWGAYERVTQPVQVFFIAPESERETVNRWRKYIFGEGTDFKGFQGYAGIPCAGSPDFDIFYTNSEEQLEEIVAAISMQDRSEGTEYFAIYLTPHSRFSRFPRQKQTYYDVREQLLKYNIQMQCVTLQTGKSSGIALTCSLNNIAIAALGKLGGTPWAVKPVNEHELIIGISAYTNPGTGLKHRASAVCFESNGKFRRQNAFTDDNPTALAGKVAAEIRRYRDLYDNPKRLIIHYYKKMSRAELDPIMDALKQMKLDIDIYVVTINKTEAADLVAFDVSANTHSLLPVSGTIVKVFNDTFLLYNNMRQIPSDNPTIAAGNPYGLKLHIMCTNPTVMEKGFKVADIIAQVYQFSRLYWSTGKQQPYPITQIYTERLARHAAHTSRTDLPEAAKARPFYL